MKSQKTVLLLVLLATGLLYARSLRYDFTYDDNYQIVLNPTISSASQIPQYFTTHVWANITPESVANYYRPVFLLWLFLNYKLFGLSPAGWHATTILVHLIATWLVFVFAKRLTSDQLVATVAAFLFGIHPVHIESVAWISGVTDPLMTVFFLAAFVFYLQGSTENRGTVFLFLSVFFYVLALLSKETSVIFLPIVICYELIAARQSKRLASRLLVLIPYLLLTGIYFIVRSQALGGLAHQLNPLSTKAILLTIPSVLWFYLNHLVFPLPISEFYDYTNVSGGWLFWGPLVGLVIVAAIYLVLAKHSRLVLFLGCWVLLPILPHLNLTLFKPGEIVKDRYLYLPSVGFCIILAVAFFHVIRNYSKYRTATISVLLIVGAGWALETVIEIPQWRNDLALYTHGAAVAPNNNAVINNLATTLKFSGDVEGAIVLSKKVLVRDPNNWQSLYNLGHSYYMIGANDEAIKCLAQSIALNPASADQYLFYGLAVMKKGDIADAEGAFRTAVSLRPTKARNHFALGVLLKQKGDFREASVELKKSIELDQSLETSASPLLAEIGAGKH